MEYNSNEFKEQDIHYNIKEYNSNEFKEHSSHDTGLFCRWLPTFQAQLPPSFGFKIRC
jgi:hypothetical protein